MTQHAILATLLLVSVAPTQAAAGACDYKPSALVGSAREVASAGLRQGAVAAAEGARAAGHYALMHPGAGLTMVTSAAPGASGLAAGAAGMIGTVGAILTAPISLTVGAVTFGAVGAYEGLCYFSVERVTDEAEVRRILESIAERDPNVRVLAGADGDRLELRQGSERQVYPLKKLYIADGVLRHRDWLLNTNLGEVAWVAPESAPEAGSE